METSAAVVVAEVMRELGYDPGYTYMDNYAYTGFTSHWDADRRDSFAVFERWGLLRIKRLMGEVLVHYGTPEDVVVVIHGDNGEAMGALAQALSERLGRPVRIGPAKD